MDEEIETLVVGVRADTQAFARDVGTMRSTLEGDLGAGVDRAGRALERGLLSALQRGRFGFEDLRKVAISVLDEIAAAALQAGLSQSGGGAAGGSLSGLFAGLLGMPGRATGGPVSPGRAFVVGERGPELFVPTSSGRIETAAPVAGMPAVRLTINVAASGSSPAQAIERSSRQVARAVGRAIQNAQA